MFSHAEHTLLFECQNVCRRWKEAACVLYYQHIQFSKLSQLYQFNQRSAQDTWLGKRVKAIDFRGLMLDNIDETCPHVEKIFAGSNLIAFYEICNFLCRQYWYNIKNLTEPNWDIKYLETAMACKNSL